MMTIRNNIRQISKRIPKDVVLVAASKKQSVEDIQKAIGCGIKIIGENYVQEADKKYQLLNKKASIHLIGHLQSNKARIAARIFDMVQTIDSKKIASVLNKECEKIKKTMPVLIEVNIADEESKSGCKKDELNELAKFISIQSNLRLKGIMIMPPAAEENTDVYFKQAFSIFKNLKKKYPDADILSMGMSDSFELAIKNGSNMVRIGTSIFGKRSREKEF